MSQIFRANKAEVLTIIRNYGSQRHPNYYEVLRISPNATQKEIKRAFIELSKKMHPDVTGNNNYTDFVKVNEAYNVLSKETSRQDYDITLKYNRTYNQSDTRAYYHNPYTTYASQREWETRMAGRRWSQQYNVPHKPFPLSWILMFMLIGVGLQVMLINHSITLRRNILLQTSHEYSTQYYKTKAEAKARVTQEQWDEFPDNVQKKSVKGNDF